MECLLFAHSHSAFFLFFKFVMFLKWQSPVRMFSQKFGDIKNKKVEKS
jgi:hypothetical protein